jgi:hypothetical protein
MVHRLLIAPALLGTLAAAQGEPGTDRLMAIVADKFLNGRIDREMAGEPAPGAPQSGRGFAPFVNAAEQPTLVVNDRPPRLAALRPAGGCSGPS